MKEKIQNLRNHVHEHRGAYASIATSIVLGAVMSHRAKQWNEFLLEEGIDPRKFYCPEAYEEALEAAAR